MKIFRNRGDIYLSKTNIKSDFEQRILLILLAAIIVITSVFVILVGIRNDFSIKNFFQPEAAVAEEAAVADALPEVEGKTNFLILNEENGDLLFAVLLQVDLDNIAYKVCTLDPETKADEATIFSLYRESGVQKVTSALEQEFSIYIDYYIAMENSNYIGFIDKMGKVNYPILSDIKYKETDSNHPYSVKFKAGEQSLDGSDISKLIRYYSQQENHYRTCNDIILCSLNQLVNTENGEQSEVLFRQCISSSATNITVKDFTAAADGLTVLTAETTGVNAYNVEVCYENGEITDLSKDDVKGYFSK